MASVLDGMNKPKSSTRRAPLQRNIGFRVTGYDIESEGGPFVLGVAVSPTKMAGENVKVRLYTPEEAVQGFPDKGIRGYRGSYQRKDPVTAEMVTVGRTDAENAKHFKQRPTVEKWMTGYKVGANNVQPVPVGGLMVASSTIKIDDTFVAQYLDQYGRDNSYGITYGAATLHLYPETVGSEGKPARKQAAYFDVLSQEDAVLLKTSDDVRNFFEANFPAKKGDVEHSPTACIRFIDTKADQIKASWIAPAKEQKVVNSSAGERTVSVAADADKSLEKFTSGDSGYGMGKLVAHAFSGKDDPTTIAELSTRMYMGQDAVSSIVQGVRDGSILVEAIPGERIKIVDENLLDQLFDDATVQGRTAKSYQLRVDPARPNASPKLGLIPTTIGIYTSRKEGYEPQKILSGFSTDRGFTAMKLEQVWSPNYQHKTGLNIEKNADIASQAAAEAGVDAGLDLPDESEDLAARTDSNIDNIPY